MRKRVAPQWKGRHLKEITRSDVAHLINAVEGGGARRMRFALIRKMFKWAVSNGDIAESPIRDMEPPPTLPSRERVLSEEELALCWNAAADLSEPFASFVRMLAITGQRREEVAGTRWQELNRQQRLWTIPGERVKNGTTHDVPLSDAAIALLDQLAGVDPEAKTTPKWPPSGLVFTTTGETAISGFSKMKKRLDASMRAHSKKLAEARGDDPYHVQLVPWRLHDLRRTLATGLRLLGFSLDTTEAVLNHKSGSRSGIVQVYQRHEYRDEKRAALQGWADHVLKIAHEAAKELRSREPADDDAVLHAA
jgi:integrase